MTRIVRGKSVERSDCAANFAISLKVRADRGNVACSLLQTLGALAVVALLVNPVAAQSSNPAPNLLPNANPQLLTPTENTSNGNWLDQTKKWWLGRPAEPSAPQRYALPEHNLEFIAPGPGWKIVPPRPESAPNTVLTIGNYRQKQFLKVITEDLGADLKFTAQMLQENEAFNYRSILVEPKISHPEPFQVDGIDGLKTVVRGQSTASPLLSPSTFISWVSIHNGVTLNIVSWCPTSQEHHLMKTWESIPDCLRLIDRNRVIESSDQISVELKSEVFGVKADLSGTSYFVPLQHLKIAGESPLVAADFNNHILAVYPYCLPDDRPSRKMLVENILNLYDADVQKARQSARMIRHGQYDAIEYLQLSQDNSDERQRFYRICFAETCVWLLYGEANAKSENALKNWQHAVSRIQLTPQGSYDLEQFSEIERSRHGLLYLQLGYELGQQGHPDRMINYSLLDVDSPSGIAWDRGYVADFPGFAVSQLRQGGLSCQVMRRRW